MRTHEGTNVVRKHEGVKKRVLEMAYQLFLGSEFEQHTPTLLWLYGPKVQFQAWSLSTISEAGGILDAGPTPNNSGGLLLVPALSNPTQHVLLLPTCAIILLQHAKRTLAMRAAGVEGLEKAAAEAAEARTRAVIRMVAWFGLDGSNLGHHASLPATVACAHNLIRR